MQPSSVLSWVYFVSPAKLQSDRTAMYTRHPSKILNDLFAEKPYQGVPPEDAKFLFIGLDANYSPTIDREPIFQKVCEYHSDGAAFWKKHKVHHPFLLPQYKGDGRKYHLNFAKIGFTAEHADHVSFAELLHVPTVGSSQLEPPDLSARHLSMLNHAITIGKPTHIFVSDKVLRMMSKSKEFSWLPSKYLKTDTALQVVCRFSGKVVYKHLHFSSWWGKFEQRGAQEAVVIRGLL